MRTLLAGLCFFALGAVQAKAHWSVKEYRERMASEEMPVVIAIKQYVRGLGDGIIWANTEESSRKTPLFCEPQKLALGNDNYIDILDRQIKKQSSRLTAERLEESSIGLLLMMGLMETFPCESSK